MKSQLEKQIDERNKNLEAGEIIVYSDSSNYSRYKVLTDLEVLTGDILIQKIPENKEDTEHPEIITLGSLQYGWRLEAPEVTAHYDEVVE